MAESPRYRVMEAMRDRLAEVLDPPAGLLRIGWIAYQQIHAFPAVFLTIGPGSVTARQQHRAWEHRFMVRIVWVPQSSDAEPLEHRGLQIHDQILAAFHADKTLGGLCLDMELLNTLGTDEGQLVLAGLHIGEFFQDVRVLLMVAP